MAYYNNGFPATYQPMYQPYTQPYTQVAPVQQPNQNVRPSVQDRIIVQGIEGAKAYLVAPNNSVDLWDSEAPVIYQKSADPSGMPSIKILDYTVRESASNTPNSASKVKVEDLSIYATKDEIKAVSDQIAALKSKVYDFIGKKKVTKLLDMEEEDE
jgi:hypothetical protein